LHRAGELTAVYVPDCEDEAMRDLTRARGDAVNACRKTKQQLKAFLLRHAIVYNGKSSWSKAYFNWLSDIAMAHPAQQVALQAARGVSMIVAVTILSELGDLSRFENPPQLMAYLGLVPSENSTGNKVKRGGITKTGNGHVRKVLVEAAWAYRMKPRVSRILLKRQQHVAKEVRRISWKAQLRLCTRFRRMAARGKPQQVVATAIARELSGFLWAMAKQVQPVT